MDTICAISTTLATSAIGMIRVSGEQAISICDKIVKLRAGTLETSRAGQMRLCKVMDGDTVVDEPMVVVFRAPNSYTGEDTVEFNCHGGLLILERVMKLLIANGARSATGGEFTKRAFLNGKLDLVQAEAVCDLINAQSELDASVALSHMSGRLSAEFDGIFETLIALNTDILAYIDFPDEGLSDVSENTVLDTLYDVRKRLQALERSFNVGSVIHDGIDTVIVGAPNVGKSTLLNAIVGYERAIVSDVAGTTRDVVTERVRLGGIVLNIADTAGIREDAGDIERLGIQLAKKRLDGAKLCIAVFDGSRELCEDDMNIISLCKDKTCIAVINKSDMGVVKNTETAIRHEFENCIVMSAKDSHGVDGLVDTVRDLFIGGDVDTANDMLITNARHFERVVKALEKVTGAVATVENGFTPDLASIDITDAASELGQVTGRSVAERIIDDIFSKFCVGK